MNATQFLGVAVFSLGIALIILGTIAAIFFGKKLLELLFLGATGLLFLGILIVLVSIAVERLRDIEKDKKIFGKMEGRK